MGLDQFTTKSNHLGKLNEIHLDLLVSNLNLVLTMYPVLCKKPIRVYIEANLSHDLAAFMEKSVRNYYSQNNIKLKEIMFVKQFDSKGKLLPGILTRHKANLVSYFSRIINQGQLYIARQISTVSSVIEERYDDMCHLTRNDLLDIADTQSEFCRSKVEGAMCVSKYPTAEEMANVVKALVEQATLFRCYSNNKSVIYSGKRSTKSLTSVDDMLMALILCTAWAKLPSNSYMLC